mgnify:CR=1 FL=1
MQLLRKVASFGSSQEEMVLTKENEDDLERTQKTFAKLELGDSFTTYFEVTEHFTTWPTEIKKRETDLGFC